MMFGKCFPTAALALLVIISWMPFSLVYSVDDPQLLALQERIKVDLDTEYSEDNLKPGIVKKIVAILSSSLSLDNKEDEDKIKEFYNLDEHDDLKMEECRDIVKILGLDKKVKYLFNLQEEDLVREVDCIEVFRLLKLKEKDFLISPEGSVETIRQKLAAKLNEILRLKLNFMEIEQIISSLENEMPRVKIGDKITIKTKNKGTVTGRLNKVLAKKHIVIGTRFILLTELSEQDRIRIAEEREEYQKFILSEAQKRFAKASFALENEIKDELKKQLPIALFRGGYLPYPKSYIFDLSQAKPENWGTRQQIVDACIAAERKDYVKNKMNSAGYILVKGYGWIKKEKVNEYQISAGVFNEAPKETEIMTPATIEKRLLLLVNQFDIFLHESDRNEEGQILYDPKFIAIVLPIAQTLNKQTILVKNGKQLVNSIVIAAVDWEYAVKKMDLAEKYEAQGEMGNYFKCLAEHEAQLRKANYHFNKAISLYSSVKKELESINVR